MKGTVIIAATADDGWKMIAVMESIHEMIAAGLGC